MPFAKNIQAMNAARKQFGPDYKMHCTIEKLDGMWHVQVKPIEDAANAIADEAKVIADGIAQADAKRAELISSAADAIEQFGEDELERYAAQAEADRIANAQASEQQLPNGKIWVRQSSILKPTKAVWAIADEMRAANPAITRKEVQDECVRRGIASGTARTQYQAWKTANDSASSNQALAAELSAKFNGK